MATVSARKPQEEQEAVRKLREEQTKAREKHVTSSKKKINSHRSKYLEAVVNAIFELRDFKGSLKSSVISRMKQNFPHFPWDNKPVIKKYIDLALKTGQQREIIVKVECNTSVHAPPRYRLTATEVKHQKSRKINLAKPIKLFGEDYIEEEVDDLEVALENDNVEELKFSSEDVEIDVAKEDAAHIQEDMDHCKTFQVKGLSMINEVNGNLSV